MPTDVRSMGKVRVGGRASALGRTKNTAVPQPSNGALLRQVGQVAEALAVRQAEQADNLKMVRAQASFEQGVQQGLEGLDPTSSEYAQRVDELLAERKSEAADLADLTRNSNRDAFNLKLENQGATLKQVALRLQRGAQRGEAQRLFGESATKLADQVRQDPDGLQDYQARINDELDQYGDLFSAEERAGLEKAATLSTIEATVEGLTEQRRYQDADAFIAAHSSELTSDQRRGLTRMRKGIETGHRQEDSKRLAQTVADLDTALLEADSLQDINAVEDNLRDLKDSGALADQPNIFPQRLARIQAAQKALIEDQRERQGIIDAYNGDSGFASADQASKAFEMVAEGMDFGSEETGAQYARQALSVASKGGFYPKQVAGDLVRANQSDDPALLAEGAVLYRDLQELAPNAGGAPKAKSVQRLETVSMLIFAEI